MGGLFGGGGKKSSGTATPPAHASTPTPTAPAVDPGVVAADAHRRAAAPTIMTAGVPTMDHPATETIGGSGSYG